MDQRGTEHAWGFAWTHAMSRSRDDVKKVHAFALLLAALGAAGCTAEASGDGLPTRPTEGTDFKPGAGPAQMTSWAALPALGRGQYRMFAGYDRNDDSSYPVLDPGNKDFNNFLAVCGVDLSVPLEKSDDSGSCAPGLRGYLVASDDHGPGVVSRSLFAVGTIDPLSGADVTFDDERVRIYVDDLTTPIYDGLLADWRSGTASPFVPPLTTWTSGSLVTYMPISYQSKLRILLDNLSTTSAYYHRIDVLSGTEPSSFAPRTRKVEEVAANLGAFRKEARQAEGKTAFAKQEWDLAGGSTATLVDAKGPGTIDVVHLKVDSTDISDLRSLQLTMRWDDQAEPGVDSSLDRLFGAQQTVTPFDTLPMTVVVSETQTDMTLSLPMPFASRATVTLTNTGGRPLHFLAEAIGSTSTPAGEWGYFHAAWREKLGEFAPNERYVAAELAGAGKYVGTMMYVVGQKDPETATPSPFNFLEGDDRTVVDGTASLGTGTEDVFDGGWYFIDGRYDRPFTALIAKTSNDDTGVGAVSMLRWNVLANAIPFRNSFLLDFEVGARRPVTGISYASVAFYYLK